MNAGRNVRDLEPWWRRLEAWWNERDYFFHEDHTWTVHHNRWLRQRIWELFGI